MFRRALLFVIVYAVFNLAALYASSDSIHDQKLADLEKCLNNINTAGDKEKIICHNVTDFETVIKSFKNYLSQTHENRTVNENREYIKTIVAALIDKDYDHVAKNKHCINVSKAEECRRSRYEVSTNLTLKKRLFNRNHEINRKRNSCNDAENISACILKNAITKCDNITAAYFKKIMDKQAKACSEITDNGGKNKGDTASGLRTILGSIFITLFTTLLL